jgi:hypothetical protein
LANAITTAGFALSPSGKRLHHQRRVPQAVLDEWTKALRAASAQMQRAKWFDDLHQILAGIGYDLVGIGKLTVYDTALRIGAFLRLEPDRVYLHAGTQQGARALGLRGRGALEVSALPAQFHLLTPAEIEDVLCIYKDALRSLKR